MRAPWADDRVYCRNCAHYRPIEKWHPARDKDGAHKRVTLDGCDIDRAHIRGDLMRRCPFLAYEPRGYLGRETD
jgi:hypothetical protein